MLKEVNGPVIFPSLLHHIVERPGVLCGPQSGRTPGPRAAAGAAVSRSAR